jgi:hypothetical protein
MNLTWVGYCGTETTETPIGKISIWNTFHTNSKFYVSLNENIIFSEPSLELAKQHVIAYLQEIRDELLALTVKTCVAG